MTYEHNNDIPEILEPTNELCISMRLLLDIQDHSEDPYYQAEWDPESLNRIIGVTTMRAVTTGARKECVHNTFRQAQLLITETDTETPQAKTERFIWIPTPPQNPGDPIIVDKEHLRHTLGYRPLSPEYIAADVIGRATSPEDYAAVIALMVEKGIPTFSHLHSRLNHLIGILGVNARHVGDSAMQVDAEATATALTEIFQALPEADLQAATYLKTRLLGAIATSLKWGNSFTDDPDITAYQNRLVALTITMLGDKAISVSSNMIGRICGAYPIHRAPLGTTLLYNRLKDTYAKSTSETLFNRPRAAFASGYIAEVLGAVLRENANVSLDLQRMTNGVIHAGAQMSHLKHNDVVNFDALLATCTALPQHEIDLPQPHKENQVPVIPLEKVSLAFYSLLENLHDSDQGTDQSTQYMNSIRAQNVHMLLTPLIFLERVRLRRRGQRK